MEKEIELPEVGKNYWLNGTRYRVAEVEPVILCYDQREKIHIFAPDIFAILRENDPTNQILERLERIEKALQPVPIFPFSGSEEDARRMVEEYEEYKRKRCPLDGSPIPEEGE